MAPGDAVAPAGTVDAHIHLFPPEVRENRQRYLDSDSFFAHLYGNPRAPMVGVEQALADMDRDGVARAVIAGWPWQSHDACVEHNSWAMEQVRLHPGRLSALASVHPGAGPAAVREVGRCLDGGMSGVGEFNSEGQICRLDSPGVMAVAQVCMERGAPLLLHTNEPVGHIYPGKGSLGLAAVFDLIRAAPELRLVLAHWGGGFPFYELMPEVRRASVNVCYDTAASPLLYEPRVFRVVVELVGAPKVLFGSDYPLNLYPGKGGKAGFRRVVDEIRSLEVGADAEARILGSNARRVFKLGS
jgi:predicted TIM-barrel fold metal-dependent hydrolase